MRHWKRVCGSVVFSKEKTTCNIRLSRVGSEMCKGDSLYTRITSGEEQGESEGERGAGTG